MSSWFKLQEFLCHCGDKNCDAVRPQDPLVAKLNVLRDRVGRPITIISGSRCAKNNAKVGGVKESAHMTGWAADLFCPDSPFRFALVEACVKDPLFSRIGVGARFLHVDCDPSKAPHVLWVYEGAKP